MPRSSKNPTEKRTAAKKPAKKAAAKKPTTKRKVGRPQVVIDRAQFEKLCGLQCTEIEIAAFFKCHIDTLSDWCVREYGENFSDVSKKYRQIGNISLRRTQFKLAEKNAAMAIFLGKQYLGQTDKTEVTVAEIDDGTRRAVEDFLNDTGTGIDTE